MAANPATALQHHRVSEFLMSNIPTISARVGNKSKYPQGFCRFGSGWWIFHGKEGKFEKRRRSKEKKKKKRGWNGWEGKKGLKNVEEFDPKSER